MTFFGIFREAGSFSFIFIIFTLLSLRSAWSGFKLGRVITGEWRSFVADPLTTRKKQMADQAAILIMVPISVAIHEFGHALATWQFGGRIVDFGYAFFWGYVLPVGNFTVRQDWFISLAGTLGSLLFGLFVWSYCRSQSSVTLRYLGLRTLRYQIYFALIFYPIFTVLATIGDWRVIYNFNRTPTESGIVAGLHGVILLASYIVERRGGFDLPAVGGAAAQTLRDLEEGRLDFVNAPDKALAAAEALLAGDSANRANTLLRRFEAANPAEPRIYLLQAQAEMAGQQRVSRKVRALVEKALGLGLSQPVDIAAAQQLLANYQGDRDPAAALPHFERAISALDPTQQAHLRRLYVLYYQRHGLNRQLGRYDEAFADLNAFRAAGVQLNIQGTAAQYDKELSVLRHHSGQAYAAPDG